MTKPTPIQAVHHAHIVIPPGADQRARDFYCGVLGLNETPKPENLKNRGGFWLQLPNAQVHVGVQEGIDSSKSKAHVAYVVNDLEEMRSTITGQGIECQDGLPIPGFVRFECRDPFGNRMEFIQQLEVQA